MSGLKDFRVLVSATSYGKNDPRLREELEYSCGEVVYNTTGRPLQSAELAQLLPGMDGFIAGLDTIDARALQAADRLKVIARYGVGVDRVDLEAARRLGIVVTNTPGANAASVAEWTVTLILALARRFAEQVSATRRGEWPRVNGLSLQNRTIGLVGFGAIGKATARRLAGFECKILTYDPYLDAGAAEALGVMGCSLDELLAQAEFVSLHAPSTAETRGMVDEAFLAHMKPNSYLVNTARGDLVDENALAQAIYSGHLAGAALDVFAQEPPDPANPLLGLPQVLVTPHSSSHSDSATNNMGWMALHDCLAVLRGEAPKNRVA